MFCSFANTELIVMNIIKFILHITRTFEEDAKFFKYLGEQHTYFCGGIITPRTDLVCYLDEPKVPFLDHADSCGARLFYL